MLDNCSRCKTLSKCVRIFETGTTVKCPYFGELREIMEKLPKSSVKTCRNCKNYQPIMSGTGEYHIHDYWFMWQKQIPRFEILDRFEFEGGYDDIESGFASCWAFEQKDGEIQTEFPVMFSRL